MISCKFWQTNRLTGKVLEKKELAPKAYKEQNGARPLRAEADSGIAELGREVRENRGGEETSVTKNVPKWEERGFTTEAQRALRGETTRITCELAIYRRFSSSASFSMWQRPARKPTRWLLCIGQRVDLDRASSSTYCAAMAPFASSSSIRFFSSGVSFSGSRTTTNFFSVPVKAKGILST